MPKTRVKVLFNLDSDGVAWLKAESARLNGLPMSRIVDKLIAEERQRTSGAPKLVPLKTLLPGMQFRLDGVLGTVEKVRGPLVTLLGGSDVSGNRLVEVVEA